MIGGPETWPQGKLRKTAAFLLSIHKISTFQVICVSGIRLEDEDVEEADIEALARTDGKPSFAHGVHTATVAIGPSSALENSSWEKSPNLIRPWPDFVTTSIVLLRNIVNAQQYPTSKVLFLGFRLKQFLRV